MISATSSELYADRDVNEEEHALSPEEAEDLRDVTGRIGSEDSALACELESIDLALLKIQYGEGPQLLSEVYEGELSASVLCALVEARTAAGYEPGPQ